MEFSSTWLVFPLIFQYDDMRYLHVDQYSGANQWLGAGHTSISKYVIKVIISPTVNSPRWIKYPPYPKLIK